MADPIEVVGGCLEMITSVIELIKIWKEKDQYLDSVSEFLNSIGDTIEKYQADESLKNKRQLAYDALNKELLEFKKYLNDQKKKGCIVRFFKGNDFIRGCEKHIEVLQGWMTGMQLDLSLHFGEVSAKNFKELFKMLTEMQKTQNSCNLKFQNNNAACLWFKYFEYQENVEWIDFKLHFSAFVFKTEKIQLSDHILESILEMVDSDGNKIVNYTEWDDFYGLIWSRFEKKAKLLMSKEEKKVNSLNQLPPMRLIYLETNEAEYEKYKSFDFPKEHQFIISQTGFNYNDIHNKNIEKEELWYWEDRLKHSLQTSHSIQRSTQSVENNSISLQKIFPMTEDTSSQTFQLPIQHA